MTKLERSTINFASSNEICRGNLKNVDARKAYELYARCKIYSLNIYLFTELGKSTD